MSPWFSLTGALIAGGIAAGAAGLAHDIQGFVNGETPWSDPGKWVTGALKAGAIGFGTGVIGGVAGQAIGPALGAAGDALGVGSNAGTTAVQAGAATPTNLGAAVSPGAVDVVGAGAANASESTIGNTVGTALQNAGKQGFVGALTGTARDPQNPLRGAVSGAVGGAVGGGLTSVGQTTGMFSSAPTRELSINYQPSTPQYSLAGPQMGGGQAASMVQTIHQPGFTDSLGGLGTRLASGAAGTLAQNAMTPTVAPPQPGTYAPWSRVPAYWERSGFQ